MGAEALACCGVARRNFTVAAQVYVAKSTTLSRLAMTAREAVIRRGARIQDGVVGIFWCRAKHVRD
jgi:hypothetical protein